MGLYLGKEKINNLSVSYTTQTGGGTSGSQTGVVDTSASYKIIYTYFPDAVSVTVPTRVVTATSASGELQT